MGGSDFVELYNKSNKVIDLSSLIIANADDELVLLIDKKNNLEIVVRELSLETNFNATTANCYNELVEFAKKIEFPSHALILKIGEKETGYFLKGIQSWELLEKSAKRLFENNSQIVAETDMRALYNPTRMKVIEKATLKLVEKSKV